jgi:hypothetical protein
MIRLSTSSRMTSSVKSFSQINPLISWYWKVGMIPFAFGPNVYLTQTFKCIFKTAEKYSVLAHYQLSSSSTDW